MTNNKVTTVYPDGTVEERDMTPDEIAQRETDLANMKAQMEAEAARKAEIEANRESARAKFRKMGLTEDEIDAIIR